MRSSMSFILFVAALAGCHNVAGNGDGNPNPDDTTGSHTAESGTAIIQYGVSVLGSNQPSEIVIACDGEETMSTSTGQPTEVPAPTWCDINAGLAKYIGTFGYPVVEANGEYWAATPISVEVTPNGQVSGNFITFNVFEPSDYVCWYDKYELDESASNLKGEQWMEHEEIDKQFIAVLQDGTVEAEGDQNMSVIGRDGDHMQVVDDKLVLVVESGGNPYYIADSDIGVNYFNLTTVNTEAGYVADVWCELDE
jgi:hypothetical protein